MPYIRNHARFTILDAMPADVWQEPEDDNPRTHVTDPDRYLCIVGEEPADYHGNFTACVYSEALYQRYHTGVSAEYLDRITPAPEDVARKIIAHYLRHWASMEDDDAAALLLEDADRIARG